MHPNLNLPWQVGYKFTWMHPNLTLPWQLGYKFIWIHPNLNIPWQVVHKFIWLRLNPTLRYSTEDMGGRNLLLRSVYTIFNFIF